jgi:hypothetical protein
MKKLITSFLLIPAAAMAEKPCEMTEQPLRYEISILQSRRKTIDDEIQIARLYDAMARRGCAENKQTWQGYAKASIQAARGLNEAYNDRDNSRTWHQYDNMINQANPKSY